MKSLNSGEINALLLFPGLCDDDDVYSGLYGVVILSCCCSASSKSHTLSSLVNAKWMTVAVSVVAVAVSVVSSSSSDALSVPLSVSDAPRDAPRDAPLVTRGGWV